MRLAILIAMTIVAAAAAKEADRGVVPVSMVLSNEFDVKHNAEDGTMHTAEAFTAKDISEKKIKITYDQKTKQPEVEKTEAYIPEHPRTYIGYPVIYPTKAGSADASGDGSETVATTSKPDDETDNTGTNSDFEAWMAATWRQLRHNSSNSSHNSSNPTANPSPRPPPPGGPLPPGPSSGGTILKMKPKLDAAAKAKAKKAGEDLAASYTEKKDDKKAADAKMNKEEIATAEATKAKKKNTWKAKKKKVFKGIMTLTGIDLTKTDTATKNAKAAFEEATAAELNLTEEDEITFTYTKVVTTVMYDHVTRRRRLLVVGTTVSYEITVAEDTAVALEAKLTEDPECTAIVAMSAALSTDFPEAVTAEVVSVENVAAETVSKISGAAAITVTWAAGAASVAVFLALW